MKTEKDILRIRRNIKRLGERVLIEFFHQLKGEEGDECAEEDEDGWIVLNAVIEDLKKGKDLEDILTDKESREHYEKEKPSFELGYGTIFEVKKKKHPMGKEGEWFWIKFGYDAGYCCGDCSEFWVQKIDETLVIDDEMPAVQSIS